MWMLVSLFLNNAPKYGLWSYWLQKWDKLLLCLMGFNMLQIMWEKKIYSCLLTGMSRGDALGVSV